MFPDQIEIVGIPVRGSTGCFDVAIKGSSKLLHSKKGGDGEVNEVKFEKIVQGIRAALGQ